MPNDNLSIIPMGLSLFYDMSFCQRLAPNTSFFNTKKCRVHEITQKEVDRMKLNIKELFLCKPSLCFGFTLNE